MGAVRLEEYMDHAILSDGKIITDASEGAKALSPALCPGAPLPAAFCPGDEGEDWEGVACLDGRQYRLRCLHREEGLLITLQAQEQQAMTEGQLDGALYQLRTLMGEFRQELGACMVSDRGELTDGEKTAFVKSYDRMLRLLDHLDLLRDVAGEQYRVEKQEVELGSLCEEVARECDGLLREMGVRVDCTRPPVPVYALAAPECLRDVLVELISNCARRRKKGGAVSVSLSLRRGQALVCVTDDGGPANSRQRMELTARGSAPRIPAPEEGAGLGLSVAEQLMWLQGGSLLASAGEQAPRVYLSLPQIRPGGRLVFHSPRLERNAGRSPYVIGLADVLPGEIIREDWKD